MTARDALAPELRAALTVARQHGFTGDEATLAGWLADALARPVGPTLSHALAALDKRVGYLVDEVEHALDRRRIRRAVVGGLLRRLGDERQAVARALVVAQTTEAARAGSRA